MHHAYVIEGEAEEGMREARKLVANELRMDITANPDVVELRYRIFTPEDARRVAHIANQGPVAGEKKAILIAAGRAYHEAQNALLKLFEEPPANTFLFFIIPNAGALLPTLRSRVELIGGTAKSAVIAEPAQAFLKMNAEKRSAFIKKLATGKDEDERREHRDEAIVLVNGIEQAAFEKFQKKRGGEAAELLSDISLLRSYLYDRSAPVRLILEHLSLVLPTDLL